jgi:creatinine amidohydrolase
LAESPLWMALTSPEVAAFAAGDPVAVLPLAAVEQHGPHLPLSTDVDIGEGILREALHRVSTDLPVRVLPTLAVGASAEHGTFAGTLSLEPGVLEAVLYGVGSGVAAAGVRRLVVFNSHGGNRAPLDSAALRLRRDRGMLVVKANWFRFPRPGGVALPEDEWRHGLHGGAVETAMMLHLHPDRVRLDRLATAPSLGTELARHFRHLGPEGEVSFAWMAGDLHPSGITGDPRLADAEMGARMVAHHAGVLAKVIEEARAFPLERLVQPGRGRGDP